jgi:hypothetical protein
VRSNKRGKGILEEHILFNNINSIFEKYSKPWNSLDKTTALKVFDEEVLIEIDKIYDYVSKYSVDWKTDTMETVTKRLERDIRANFPFLNEKAIGILKNYFAYEWK